MEFSITYDDSDLRKAVAGLLQKEGRIKFHYDSQKSDNRLTGTGKKLWFFNAQTDKWYLPAKWRLQNKTWNQFVKTQKEYLDNRHKNFKSAMSGQRIALEKKLDVIIRKFNRS